jgi:hypothetical protein
MPNLTPASARPDKPWRISATPSPARPNCASRPAEQQAAGQVPNERKAVLFCDDFSRTGLERLHDHEQIVLNPKCTASVSHRYPLCS